MFNAILRPTIRRLLTGRILPLWRMTAADAGVDVEVLSTAVRKVELFCNAGAPLVRAMLDMMQVRRVRQEELILRQGVRSDRFIVLASGRAEVTRSREGDRVPRALAVLTEPTGLGEEALMGAEIRSITVRMLTDGVVLEIRRANFARLVAARGVSWLTSEGAMALAQPPAIWLWIGTVKTRPGGLGADVQTIPLERLRDRLADLDAERHYLCCGRDDGSGALAAFLLMQRGFKASAVHDGRRASALLE